MELAKYKACICEGAAENAIMDILLIFFWMKIYSCFREKRC